MNNQLDGKKILVTAPAIYGQNLARLIRNNKGIALEYPAIKTYVPKDLSSLHSIFKNINDFEDIILPSRTAIDAFFKACADTGQSGNLERINFYALGKDQVYLKNKYNLKVAAEPEETGPNGLVRYFKQLETQPKKPILVVAPKVIGVPEPNVIPDFIKALSALRLKTIKIQGYMTEAQNLSTNKELSNLIAHKEIDIITFTSTAEIAVMLKYFGPDKINQFKIACFGPYTGKNAEKMGLKTWYIGQKYSRFEDFVSGISALIKA